MSPAATIAADHLRHRETATTKMIADIDDKISRLTAARQDRIAALQTIRASLVAAQARAQQPTSPDYANPKR